jgi:4-amino-4-deoxychorismate lyase
VQPRGKQAAPVTLVDGRPATGIATSERALQYGDGLFETIAVVDGRPCHWQAHASRLAEGSERLRLPAPPFAALAAEAASLCAPGRDAVLKIYWTAGDSDRGYRRRRPLRPRRIVQCFPWQRPAAAAAWTLRLCEHRCGDNPRLAGIKHLNRLDQVLARAEWDDPDIAEGVMLGQDGCLVGGTMSNLFLQRGDTLSTPPLTRAGIDGVVRRRLIHRAAQLGTPVQVVPVRPQALADADSLYLCNSLIGVVRARACAQTRYDMGRPEHPAVAAANADCHQPDPTWPA